jgi:glycosyltransferase involved in cell wall biosynthesis
MKIVVVNAADAGGGAEGVSAKLVDGLREKGHQVSFLCAQAHHPTSRALMGPADWVLGRTVKRIGYADAVSLAAWRFLKYPEVVAADVIHFHNLHGFYFGMSMLPRIIAAKPCVWTLHDCWAISGGCYSQLDCDNWLSSCKPCPGHGVHPMTGVLDTAAAMLRMKRRAFEAMVRHRGVMTGVSDWMTERARRAFTAAGLGTECIRCVPNFVDIPALEDGGPSALPDSVPAGQPVILLVAADINNRNKGMSTALGALQRNLGTPFTLLTVGSPFSEAMLQQYGLEVRTVQLGRVSDRSQLAAIYRSALVTLVPSRAESFCLVAAESISCGTPVIASDVTALPDLVQEGRTGLLAKAGDPEDFSRKLRLILAMDPPEYQALRASAREFAAGRFTSYASWLDTYLEIYGRAISEHV